MSVTMPCRGRLVWGQQPDWDAESTRHYSGSSSHMSTNSKLVIRQISFRGTDEKPGRWASWGVAPAPASTRGPVVEVAGRARRHPGAPGLPWQGDPSRWSTPQKKPGASPYGGPMALQRVAGEGTKRGRGIDNLELQHG